MRKRASGAGTEREEGVFTGAVSKAPACILATQTRNDGLRRTYRDGPGPARRCIIRSQSYFAETAQADFCDAEAGFDAATLACAGVNQGFAERPAREAKVQHCGVAAQRIRQLGGMTVDAYGLHGTH